MRFAIYISTDSTTNQYKLTISTHAGYILILSNQIILVLTIFNRETGFDRLRPRKLFRHCSTEVKTSNEFDLAVFFHFTGKLKQKINSAVFDRGRTVRTSSIMEFFYHKEVSARKENSTKFPSKNTAFSSFTKE